jgi:hypothetical protein
MKLEDIEAERAALETYADKHPDQRVFVKRAEPEILTAGALRKLLAEWPDDTPIVYCSEAGEICFATQLDAHCYERADGFFYEAPGRQCLSVE